MKKMAKKLVAAILGWQVKALRKKNNFKIVAVVGSVGKTSTKLAVAKLLQQKYKVRVQDGNYNDLVSVPLIFFDQELPSLFNPSAWIRIFWQNHQQLRRPYPYEIVLVELGTDGPGQMKQFSKYLQVDLAVLTGIALEHMEFFRDLDAVAAEELAVTKFSDQLIANQDLCSPYLKDLKPPTATYGLKPADIWLSDIEFDGLKSSFRIRRRNSIFSEAKHEAIAEPQLYSAAGAVAVAIELGLNAEQVKAGLNKIKPVSGRMNQLKGINESTIIDDTYNASPQAMKAALDTLYRLEASQKIAILGNMNELGKYSKPAHQEIGEYCDPKNIDLLVTIGLDANRWLAEAAAKKGCRVKSFNDPYSAAGYIKSRLKKGAIILAKGSQNGVFAEEAVKLLLADPKDEPKLVRQTPDWLKKKTAWRRQLR